MSAKSHVDMSTTLSDRSSWMSVASVPIQASLKASLKASASSTKTRAKSMQLATPSSTASTEPDHDSAEAWRMTPTPRPEARKYPLLDMFISPASKQSSATKTPSKTQDPRPKTPSKTPTKKQDTRPKVTASRMPTRSQTKKARTSMASLPRRATQRHLRTLAATVHSPKKLSQMLQNLCGDAGSCLAFGQYIGPTKKLFDGFVDFNHATATMLRMGAPSNNGFVYGITYERDGFRAETIMKFSQRPPPRTEPYIDNLYYEYLVGNEFINHYNLRLPCFLETYGAFMLPSNTVADLAKNREYPVATMAERLVPLNTFAYEKQLHHSCESQFTLVLLIQHIRTRMSFNGLFEEHRRNAQFANHVLPSLLFQVYGPLGALGNRFTHYDLHADNVLIYDVGPGKYVRLNYLYPGGHRVAFCTQYVAKIIDYGRSYFYVDQKANSTNVWKDVCKACQRCGEKKGYHWLNDKKNDDDSYYISSGYANVSHDLRLLSFVTKSLRKRHVYGWLSNMLVTYLDEYGTPEVLETGNPMYIQNVFDAASALGAYVALPDVQRANETAFQSKTCVGDMDIDMTLKRPMVFRQN